MFQGVIAPYRTDYLSQHLAFPQLISSISQGPHEGPVSFRLQSLAPTPQISLWSLPASPIFSIDAIVTLMVCVSFDAGDTTRTVAVCVPFESRDGLTVRVSLAVPIAGGAGGTVQIRADSDTGH